MIREIQQKQKWLKTFFIENDYGKLDFIDKFTIDDPPEAVAQNIRDILEIDSIAPFSKELLKGWIKRAETNRIFVSLSGNYHTRLKINSDEYKGFAISDFYAPFVFINNDVWETVQLFTLVHELAHLWIDKSGISNDININFREGNISNYNPIEIFCNKVAANTLMPYNIIHSVWNKKKPGNHNDLKEISEFFGVSSLSLLYRAYNLNLIGKEKFELWRIVLEKEFNEFNLNYLAKKRKIKEGKKGGPNYYLLLSKRNSIEFSKVVLDSYKSGNISGVELSNLLNLKINKISRYENFLYK